MASSTPRSSSASAARLWVGLADRDLTLLAVADGDGHVLECPLHLLGCGGGRLPEHRPEVQVEDGVPARWRGLPGCEMSAAAGLFGESGDRRPVQSGGSHGVDVDLVRTNLEVGCAGAAVEVQREVVRREDLAERHRGRVFVVGQHEAVVDPEVGELGVDEPAERVVAHPRDQRRTIAQPRRGHGDIGRAAAEELAERFDVLEAHTDLQGININPAAADREHFELGLAGGRLRTHQLALPTVFDGSAMTVPSNTRPVNSLS